MAYCLLVMSSAAMIMQAVWKKEKKKEEKKELMLVEQTECYKKRSGTELILNLRLQQTCGQYKNWMIYSCKYQSEIWFPSLTISWYMIELFNTIYFTRNKNRNEPITTSSSKLQISSCRILLKTDLERN